jgi:hypothetical protein
MTTNLLADYGYLFTWLAIISSICFFASLLFIPLIICRLPDDYFLHLHKHSTMENTHPLVYIFLRLLRYLLGAILLAAGLLMVFLPGQGLLTMMLGLSLLDFPGKQKAVDTLFNLKSIQKALNWIRTKGRKNRFHFSGMQK